MAGPYFSGDIIPRNNTVEAVMETCRVKKLWSSERLVRDYCVDQLENIHSMAKRHHGN